MGEPRPCPISPDEQYSYMSLWCLMAAPLFYSGDMTRLDPFTLNVLCNTEVIDVDQDPLGQSAHVVPLQTETFAMIKELEGGSRAVGFFNRSTKPAPLRIAWTTIGLSGPQRARDLWRQKDLGTIGREFLAEVPPRGVYLLRLEAEPKNE